jgi:hypothetical protein
MLEKREEVIGVFEMLNMGGTGVRDQRKWVLFRKLTSEGHPFREGIKDVAEGFLKLLLCVGEIKILGKEGEVLIAGMATSLVVVSAFVRPDLFTEGLYGLA